jgi:hypothetical protein
MPAATTMRARQVQVPTPPQTYLILHIILAGDDSNNDGVDVAAENKGQEW